MPVPEHVARLVESHLIAPEVKHFTFEVPGLPELPYLPGQFVSFVQEIDGKKITRAYSTASTPGANRFELCLNRVQDGLLSPWLFDLQPGDTVTFKGPLGVFTWRNPIRDSILVATGTGIAPFRGMVRSYLASGGTASLTLIFGVRHRETLLYADEFTALAEQHPNFTFLPVLSRPDDAWTGLRGHVQPHVIEHLGDRRDIDIYICGLKAMVDDLRAQLKALGVDRKQIIFEKYD